MAIDLPEKTNVEARTAEEARRMNVEAPGIPQLALDCVEELREQNRSPSEAFTEFGFGLRVVKAAIKDQARIVRELATKPSADVADGVLKVADVRTKKAIPEFVPKVIEKVVVGK